MTLIEVMITVIISSVIAASTYQMYAMQKKSSTVHQQVSQAQQSLRGIMDFLVQRIQMSGYDRLNSANAGFVSDFATDIFNPDIDYDTTKDMIAFTIDSNENGVIDVNDDEQIAFRLNGTTIERYLNAVDEWAAIAENIDALNFVLLDSDRNVTTDVNEVREVEMGVTGRPQESHAAIGNSILSGIPIGSTCSRYGYNRSVSFSMR